MFTLKIVCVYLNRTISAVLNNYMNYTLNFFNVKICVYILTLISKFNKMRFIRFLSKFNKMCFIRFLRKFNKKSYKTPNIVTRMKTILLIVATHDLTH